MIPQPAIMDNTPSNFPGRAELEGDFVDAFRSNTKVSAWMVFLYNTEIAFQLSFSPEEKGWILKEKYEDWRP